MIIAIPICWKYFAPKILAFMMTVNGTMMANKMSGQAISLANREAPLVQVKLNNPFTTPDGFKVDTEEKAAARITVHYKALNNLTSFMVEL